MPFEAERLADESGVLIEARSRARAWTAPSTKRIRGRPESHGVVKGDCDQQRDPSNQYVAENSHGE
jgi:hypothetical protein